MTTGDEYTVMMLSTINALYGSYKPEERFHQTLDSIETVRHKIPTARILLIDNSNVPVSDNWKKEIENRVTIYSQMRHNLFSYVANAKVDNKSIAEANLTFEALNVLRQNNMIGNRIFKISARYRLSDSFNIRDYENPEMNGKFTFVRQDMAMSEDNWVTRGIKPWYEQMFYSFSKKNIDFYQHQLLGIMSTMQRSKECIEEAIVNYIPSDIIFFLQKAHVEGLKAESGVTEYQ